MPITDDRTLELLGGPIRSAEDKPKPKKENVDRPTLPPINLTVEVTVNNDRPSFPPPISVVRPKGHDGPLKGLLDKFKSRKKKTG